MSKSHSQTNPRWETLCMYFMKMPRELDFLKNDLKVDRQFLFDEYVAIFHRYDLKIVSMKS
jgi:hypothetical protein